MLQFSVRGLFHRDAFRSGNRSPDRARHGAARRHLQREAPRFEQLESKQLLTTVSNNLDTGAGSLRQAITDVNTSAIANTIVFSNLGTATIVLATELPTLTNPAGTTFSFDGTTSAITLDGSLALASDGLTIGAGANGVSLSGINLTIKNFNSGLRFLGGSTNSLIQGLTVTGNQNGISLAGGAFSGTTISGNTITLNDQNGIVAEGSVTSLTIGGTAAGAGNTITANEYGLSFQSGTYTGTLVQGNTVSNNNQTGLLLGLLGSASSTLTSLTIGGAAAGAANTISLNNYNGVEIAPGTYTNTVIAGNSITSNVRDGIALDGGATSLTIGGTAAGAGNTIAYNNGEGLFFQPGAYTSTLVQGNNISANDGSGVLLGTSGGSLTGLTLGGSTTTGAGNTIAFNQENGVEVSQGTYTSTVIQGNTIASNASYGIQLSPSGQTLQALTIGGTTTGLGNTIASNALDGIGIFGGSYTGTVVQGNIIRYNLLNGVNINQFAGGAKFAGLQVGGGTGAGNTINNNGLDGVQVNAGVYSSTFVQGNAITSNARNGVNLYAPFGEILTGLGLGGVGVGEGNTMTGNAASGLTASKGDYTGTSVAGNTISGNATGISLTNTKNLAIGGTNATFKNTVSGNSISGLFATGDLTATKIRGNAFSANPLGVSLLDAQGVSLGTAEAGGGNTITGGITGLRAVGNLSNTGVSGNAITGQTTGIQMINATGTSAANRFAIGGTTASVGNNAGNYIASTVHGLYAAGVLNNTVISGNIFSASAAGGNAMVLINATGLTVGGSLATQGNTLTASAGNALYAAGNMAGSGFYRNTLTASVNGAVLDSARSFLFGIANNASLGNLVQYNQTGVRAVGNCTGSGVCYTTWFRNVRKVVNKSVGLIVFPKA